MYHQGDFISMNTQNCDINVGSISLSPPFSDLRSIDELINESFQPGLIVISDPDFDDTTLDVPTKLESLEAIEFIPGSPRGRPERASFPGALDFQVEINSTDTHRKKYLYSAQLNRIYVDMNADFPVTFRWRSAAAHPCLYVRATVVFSDEAQAEKRVERCTQHTHDSANAGLRQEMIKNVLHSSRSIGTAGVFYCGLPDQPDSWYSVVVQLTASGTMSHAYQFVCKNSCSGGINRRAIDVIFTLEDHLGTILGRQSVGARACSCPRRDMVRDQEAEGVYTQGKRRVSNNRLSNNTSKKIKIEVVDSPDHNVVTLPELQVANVRTALAGLEVMLTMTEQAATFVRNDPQATEKYNKCITDLKAQIDKLKKK